MENAPEKGKSMLKKILIILLALCVGIGIFIGIKSISKPQSSSFSSSSKIQTKTSGVLIQEGLTTNTGDGFSLGRPSYLDDINTQKTSQEVAVAPIPVPVPVPVAQAPIAPTQATPVPVAQVPVTPTPVKPTPVVQAPTPVTQAPAVVTPVAPVNSAPVSPAPIVPTPVAPVPAQVAVIPTPSPSPAPVVVSPTPKAVTEASNETIAKQEADAKAKAESEKELASIAQAEEAKAKQVQAQSAKPQPKTASPDSIIAAHFIEDIAKYFVQNYTPTTRKGSTGTIHANPQAINTYYGYELRALPKTGDKATTRKYIVDTIYVPNRFLNLYNLYGDLFLEELLRVSEDEYGNRRGFTQDQQKQMLIDYSNALRLGGQSLQGIGTLTDYSSLLARKKAAAKSLFDERRMFMEIQARYEEARLKNNEAVKETLREDLFKCAKRIEDAEINVKLIDVDIVSQIKKKDLAMLDDKSILFLFEWVGRRNQQHAQRVANELGTQCVKLSSDMLNTAKLIEVK